MIPEDQIDLFVKWLRHARWCGEGRCHTPAIPGTDLTDPYFSHLTYWRDPVWVNTNWMIWLGLLKYGYRETAEQIRQGILELVANHGFRKYYDPFTGEGLGENHSHGLPLFIDMIKNKRTRIPQSNNFLED